MSSSTANDIIKRALVKARVLSPRDTVPAHINNQVWDDLNDMLEAWSITEMAVPYDVQESFALTSGTASYTWKVGGTFNSARPIIIKDNTFVRVGSVDYPVDLKSVDYYRRKSIKSTPGIPQILAYSPEFTALVVYLWPTPSSADSIYIKSTKPLTYFSDKTTSVDLDIGYRNAIVTNLAVKICPNFGKSVSKELAKDSEDAMEAIYTINNRIVPEVRAEGLFRLMNGGSGSDINEGPWT